MVYRDTLYVKYFVVNLPLTNVEIFNIWELVIQVKLKFKNIFESYYRPSDTWIKFKYIKIIIHSFNKESLFHNTLRLSTTK